MASAQIQCPLPKEIIIDFLLGEISLEETAAVFEHLRTCEKCNSTTEKYITVLNTMQSVLQPAVSSSLYFSLKQRIFRKKSSAKTNRSTKTVVPLTLSAVVLLFSLIASHFISFTAEQETQTQTFNHRILDSVLVTLVSPFSPVCDTVLYLSSHSLFNRTAPISIPSLKQEFYSFSSDNLDQQHLVRKTLLPGLPGIEHPFTQLSKIRALNLHPSSETVHKRLTFTNT
jgi:hypothetical protein